MFWLDEYARIFGSLLFFFVLGVAFFAATMPALSVSYEIETGGQRINNAGRVTEVFVLRKGQWVNPGWHMDSGR